MFHRSDAETQSIGRTRDFSTLRVSGKRGRVNLDSPAGKCRSRVVLVVVLVLVFDFPRDSEDEDEDEEESTVQAAETWHVMLLPHKRCVPITPSAQLQGKRPDATLRGRVALT